MARYGESVTQNHDRVGRGGTSTPTIRLALAQPDLSGNEEAYVSACVRDEWISSAGPYVHRFEEAFAEWTGAHHAVACANGTVALHLALAALGIGPGDEVIVPAMTYVASANAVSYVGADLVLADVESDTLNISAETVAAVATDRTRAVIPVDLYGAPAPVAEVRAAVPTGAFIVEDSAEAIGGYVGGRHVGLDADLATFSFFGNKTLTTGEGGMVICRDADVADTVRLLRGQGQPPGMTYFHSVVGFNYRLTNVQAAIGVAQLERVDQFIARRAQIAGLYRELLANLSDDIHVPDALPGTTHANWMMTVVLRDGDQRRRDAVRSRLLSAGIETRPAFTPIHKLPMYERSAAFPVADWVGDGAITIPLHTRLSDDDVAFIVEALSAALTTS